MTSLEESFLFKINETFTLSEQRFANKTDTKRSFQLLERNMKNIYELVKIKNTGGEKEDQRPMFTTKPLTHMTCASCSQDISKLYRKAGHYHPWSKLPLRDPNTQRFGQVGSKRRSIPNVEGMSAQDIVNFNVFSSQKTLHTDPRNMQADSPEQRAQYLNTLNDHLARYPQKVGGATPRQKGN